ncbi:MAG: hypothetical protein IT384_07770 [Deltaproteobacteria bacterium]|nr:hypothetical protein [Deltaproteobacteria bacterium]
MIWSALLVLPLAAAPGGISLELGAPEPLILGERKDVEVTIHAPESAAAAGRPLRISVNVGEFGAVTRVAEGEYRATYHLPETRFPQVALIAVWRETGPDAEITFLRIPLHGRTTLPVRARPGSALKVLVHDQEFGPWTVPASGKVDAEIVVPPGVREVIAQSERGEHRTQATVDANVPPYNRLTLAVTPYLIASDGESAATVHIFYDREGPPEISKVKLLVPSGTVTPLGRTESRYRFRYVPARSAAGSQVVLRAEIAGDRASFAEANLALGVPVPERIVARPFAGRWIADGASPARVQVLVADRLGLGVATLVLTASVSEGAVEAVRELGQGEYEVTLRAPKRYPEGGEVALALRVARGQTGSLAETIRIPMTAGAWPARAEIATEPSYPAGGQPFAILVTTFDAAGATFPGAKLALRTEGGASGPLEDLGDGRYRAKIDPDPSSDAVEINLDDESGQLRVHHTVPLRRDTPRLTLGVKAGAAFSRGLLPTGGLEVGWRPGLLSQRLVLSLGASYRFRRQELQVEGLLVRARLHTLPVRLLASYDLYADGAFAAYAGLGASLILARHSVDTPLAPSESRGLTAFGFDAVIGGAAYGLFLEIGAGLSDLSSQRLEVPPVSVTAVLGYRLGVL